jgi:hypothetical protein
LTSQEAIKEALTDPYSQRILTRTVPAMMPVYMGRYASGDVPDRAFLSICPTDQAVRIWQSRESHCQRTWKTIYFVEWDNNFRSLFLIIKQNSFP